LGEKELAQITIFDLNLDTISCSIGFIKQSIAVLTKSPGKCHFGRCVNQLHQLHNSVEIVITAQSLEEAIFEPLQQIFSQSRACKISSNKLLRRVRDLVGDGAAISMDQADILGSLLQRSETLAVASAKVEFLFERCHRGN
jgi:hypothetical protein